MHKPFIIAPILFFLCTPLFSQQKFIGLYNKGDYEKAISSCEKAISKDNKNYDAYLYKSLSYVKLGSDDATKSDHSFGVEEALGELAFLKKKDKDSSYFAAHPSEIDTILSRSFREFQFYYTASKTKKAGIILDKLITIAGKPEYIYWKGNMAMDAGETEDAIDFYNAAAKAIYLGYTNGKIKTPYLEEAFQALSRAFFNEYEPELAYTIAGRAVRLFRTEEASSDYYDLLKKSFANMSLFADEKRLAIDFNYTDTLIALNGNKPEYVLLREDEYRVWVNKFLADDSYTSADSLLSLYVCTNHEIPDALMITNLENRICMLTKIENYYADAMTEASKPVTEVYLQLLSCLGQSPMDRADHFIAQDSLVKGATLLFNFKSFVTNKVQFQNTLNNLVLREQKLAPDDNYWEDLFDIYLLFPNDKNLKDYHYKSSIAKINELITGKKFSESGDMIRELLTLYPKDMELKKLQKLWTIEDYRANYLTTNMQTSIVWHGDVTTCNAGYLDDTIKQIFLRRLNYTRRLAGLPDQSILNDAWNKKCQEAALMMEAEGNLSHTPGTDWHCYTKEGALAAGNSNLSLGDQLTSALMGELEDGGSNNYFVGHRRWILLPALKMFGLGSTDGSMSLWVLGGFSNDSAYYPDKLIDKYEHQFITWPPEGFVPAALNCARWSISCQSADFSVATVEMKAGKKVIPCDLNKVVNGYGQNTLVWEPQNMDFYPTGEMSYTVTVKNIHVDDQVKDYTYTVTIIPVEGE